MLRNLDLKRLRLIARRRDARRPTEGGTHEWEPSRGKSASRSQKWAFVASTLPGVAALIAVLFTWMQVGQASRELRISEQGQITSRFNAAVTNLGAQSMHVRLGGIYALGRIMQDSSRDEPAVTSVLSAYVRERAPLPPKGSPRRGGNAQPPADVEAVLTVLANRQAVKVRFLADLHAVDLRDLPNEAVPVFTEDVLAKRNLQYVSLASSDLRDANLSGYDLRGADFEEANLAYATVLESDLRGASLNLANLTDAVLVGSNFTGTNFAFANLHGVVFSKADESTGSQRNADLTDALLSDANLAAADLRGVHLTRAFLDSANLTNANLAGASLRDANLSYVQDYAATSAKVTGTNLTRADLRGADLRGVDFSHADLRGADLRGAKFAGARWKGAKVDGQTRGLPASTSVR